MTIVAREIINTDLHTTNTSANENEWAQTVLRIQDNSRKSGSSTESEQFICEIIWNYFA